MKIQLVFTLNAMRPDSERWQLRSAGLLPAELISSSCSFLSMAACWSVSV